MTDNVQTVQLSIIHNLEQAYYDVKKTEYKKKTYKNVHLANLSTSVP